MRRSRRFLLLFGCLIVTMGGKARSQNCGNELSLGVTANEPRQGGVVVVELKSAAPVMEVEGRWQERPLAFWTAPDSSGRFQALLGVDLYLSPGRYPLSVKARLENGDQVGCTRSLVVADGNFVVERLEVSRRFVELDSRDLRRARREADRIRNIFGSRTAERFWSGRFESPVSGVGPSGNFGKRRFFNDQPRSPHSGEDFPAPRGSPVRAAARGRVALADDQFFSGNTVILDHGLGLFTFYGHLDSISVVEGAMVEAGEPIGTIGATGRVTGPHLHWAARLNEARINPMELLEISR